MNLYLLTQNEARGYDTYDSCVVAAESAEEAQKIHPGYGISGEWWTSRYRSSTWATHLENVKVELLGVAVEGTKAGTILASFNAG
jgi:hypothetical protein